MSQSYNFDLSNRVFATAVAFTVGVFIYAGAYSYSLLFGASSGNYPQQITIEGVGEVDVAPDMAELNLGVSAKGTTAAEASQKSTETMNAILAVLKEKGIVEADIQTSGYNLAPNLEWNGTEYKEDGFKASQNVNVKVHDLTKVGEILTAATGAGATDVGGVTFSLEDQDAAMQEARIEAIAKARAKADAIEKESGIHLGKVVSYYEYSNGPIYYDKGVSMLAEGAVREDASMAVPEIQPGTQTVTLTVSFTYKVR